MGGVWYEQGLRFQCQEGCTNCCGGFPGDVWVSGEESESIASFLTLPLEQFNRTYVRRTSGGHSLKEKSNDDCIFLNQTGCSIYPVRPRQCRTFPFWAENLESRAAWQRLKGECPGIGTGRLWTREEIERIVR